GVELGILERRAQSRDARLERRNLRLFFVQLALSSALLAPAVLGRRQFLFLARRHLLSLVDLAQRRFFGRTHRPRVRYLAPHLLPFTEAAGELCDVPLVQNPELRGERPEQLAIMAHEDRGPVVALDRVLERLDRLAVEMVRR